MISTSWLRQGRKPARAIAVVSVALAISGAQTGKEGKRLSAGADSSWVVAAEASAHLPRNAQPIARQAAVAWYSVPGTDLRQFMANGGSGLSLLFPSLEEYRHAVEALTPDQIADVVRLHVAQQPTFLSDLLDQAGDEFGKLGALAGALAERRPELAKAMHEVADASLDAQRQCYTTGRVVQWHKADVSLAIQWRATLHGLEAELAAKPDTPAPVRRSAQAASAAYNLTLKELAEADRELGEPAYTQAPPHDNGLRIVLVSPENPRLASRIKRHDLPSDPWDDGLLVPLAPDEIPLVSRLEDAVVMYLSSEEYQRARTRLTPVQLERDLKARNRPGRPTPAELLDRVVHQRLALIAHLGALIEQGQAAPDTVRLLAAARKRELQVLPALLTPSEEGTPALRQGFSDLRPRLQTLRLFCTAARQPELTASAEQALLGADQALRNLP
jgi:hypothetical protein